MKSVRHSRFWRSSNRRISKPRKNWPNNSSVTACVVTQATVSRDIKELRLVKVLSEGGGYRYATTSAPSRA